VKENLQNEGVLSENENQMTLITQALDTLYSSQHHKAHGSEEWKQQNVAFFAHSA
jgi:hypothetical protein